MTTLVQRGEAIDFVTLKNALLRSDELDTVGGPGYIASLVDGVPRSTNVETYARIVKEKAALRNLIFSANKIAAAAYDQAEDAAAIALTAHRDSRWSRPPASIRRRPTATNSPRSRRHSQYHRTADSGTAPRRRVGRAARTAAVAEIDGGDGNPVVVGRWRVAAGVDATGRGRTDRLLVPHRRRPRRGSEAPDSCAPGRTCGRAPRAVATLREKGITLNDPRCQDQIIREAVEHKIRAIAFDPARAFSDGVDKGPGDLTPLTRFLRRLMRETGATIILAHHDTKPRNDGKTDDRPRAQRASGGGIFSIADAPIHVERVNEESSLLVPNLWKFSTDHRPSRSASPSATDGCGCKAKTSRPRR